MARFRLTSAHTFGNKKYKVGTTIADSQGVAIGGDVVVTGLTSSTVSNGMEPLDGAATTMLNGSKYANTQRIIPDGVNSID